MHTNTTYDKRLIIHIIFNFLNCCFVSGFCFVLFFAFSNQRVSFVITTKAKLPPTFHLINDQKFTNNLDVEGRFIMCVGVLVGFMHLPSDFYL